MRVLLLGRASLFPSDVCIWRNRHRQQASSNASRRRQRQRRRQQATHATGVSQRCRREKGLLRCPPTSAVWIMLLRYAVCFVLFFPVYSFSSVKIQPRLARPFTSTSKPSKMTTSSAPSDEIDTEEREEITPRWCPEQQIYIGGVVPSDNADVDRLLADNNGHLRIFGYGSLCWNPGKEGALSKADEGVTQTLGRAVGWKRCWAQRSADHRGTPSFQGLVCTLLADDEVLEIHRQVEGDPVAQVDSHRPPSLTEGVIYTVPPHLVTECLEELDFREKGGYERDVIDVIEDDTGSTVQALLYRGTPENPAFWPRALLDLQFAAAVMSVAVGPSGRIVIIYSISIIFLLMRPSHRRRQLHHSRTTAVMSTPWHSLKWRGRSAHRDFSFSLAVVQTNTISSY